MPSQVKVTVCINDKLVALFLDIILVVIPENSLWESMRDFIRGIQLVCEYLIEKIFDIKPSSFSPIPKVESSVLHFEPKKKFFEFKNPRNLEKISRIFFNHRRKMIKKPYNQLFNGNLEIAKKIGIQLNQRPQNLDHKTYFLLTSEYEKLIC